MVIIITGASHTGKTVLAQKMLEAYHFPYLSLDHLKMGLIRSGNTTLTPMDDDKLTDYLWPITREMIKTAIENDQNMIVEGCYVPFDWRKDFSEEYLSEIRYICLVMSDAYIDENFGAIKAHGSDVENRGDDSDCTVEWIREGNREYLEGCLKAGEPFTLIDGDYEQIIRKLVEE
ncbi:MAG: adenylate kinase [Lachnospiraceae bacterium]|nr:adenylate kinase [Lachnospiraceae bacterium]